MLTITRDWPLAIGRFILAFGHLDYLVFNFLKKHVTAEEFSAAREKTFKERLSKVAQVLAREGKSGDVRAEFEALGERFEAMRNLRNTLAHGHLHFAAGADTSGPAVSLGLPKDIDLPVSQRSSALQLDQIIAESLVLDDLIQDFQRIVGFDSDVTLEAAGKNATASVSLYSQRRPG